MVVVFVFVTVLKDVSMLFSSYLFSFWKIHIRLTTFLCDLLHAGAISETSGDTSKAFVCLAATWIGEDSSSCREEEKDNGLLHGD